MNLLNSPLNGPLDALEAAAVEVGINVYLFSKYRFLSRIASCSFLSLIIIGTCSSLAILLIT